jgi:cysteine desulfurase/selenocysteine lyase
MTSDLDPAALRAEFPILARRVHGRPLVYLDSAATTQRPACVIDAVGDAMGRINANVHRGVHLLSQEATAAYEAARLTAQRFLGARSEREIVFVRGTTEAINLVAQTFGRARVGAGDEVLTTAMEHHSNIVPWQMLCAAQGARLRVTPITDEGALDLDAFAALLGPRTRLVALAHVSNVLGTVNPVAEVTALAHARGVPVVVDGAQAVAHLPVDVTALGADFYAFSGHKVYGPTGIGVLWGRADLLEAMPPWQGGGDMIAEVTFARTTYAGLPHKHEAGTPDVAGVIGLGAALDFVARVGLPAIAAHEAGLLAYAQAALAAVPGLRVLGTVPGKIGVVTFVLPGIHAHDIGSILDREGIAIRAGHHCAQPLMARLGVAASARASFACHTTRGEIDALAAGLRRVQEVFA